MIKIHIVSFFALVLLGFPLHAQANAPVPSAPKRIVFLGDSITYAGKYIVYVETDFLLHQPSQKVEYINLGLSSETVSGLSEAGHANGQFPRPVLKERLSRVLEQLKPDIVFACYGMNDGIYLPYDKARFSAFQAGMQQLHDAVRKNGGKIIHLTPPRL